MLRCNFWTATAIYLIRLRTSSQILFILRSHVLIVLTFQFAFQSSFELVILPQGSAFKFTLTLKER